LRALFLVIELPRVLANQSGEIDVRILRKINSALIACAAVILFVPAFRALDAQRRMAHRAKLDAVGIRMATFGAEHGGIDL
jgi:hypothetical protein